MQNDLFNEEILSQDSMCIKTLRNYDEETFEERRKRCVFLFGLVPSDNIWISSDESYFIWEEIRVAYINGCYISTIFLAQSFIERKFQADYHMMLDFKNSKETLNNILNKMREDKTMDSYWIERIDKIRKKRNPLAHFKDVMNEASISQRSNHNQRKAIEILEEDAKEAIEIMYAVSRMYLKGPAKF